MAAYLPGERAEPHVLDLAGERALQSADVARRYEVRHRHPLYVDLPRGLPEHGRPHAGGEDGLRGGAVVEHLAQQRLGSGRIAPRQRARGQPPRTGVAGSGDPRQGLVGLRHQRQRLRSRLVQRRGLPAGERERIEDLSAELTGGRLGTDPASPSPRPEPRPEENP